MATFNLTGNINDTRKSTPPGGGGSNVPPIPPTGTPLPAGHGGGHPPPPVRPPITCPPGQHRIGNRCIRDRPIGGGGGFPGRGGAGGGGGFPGRGPPPRRNPPPRGFPGRGGGGNRGPPPDGTGRKCPNGNSVDRFFCSDPRRPVFHQNQRPRVITIFERRPRPNFGSRERSERARELAIARRLFRLGQVQCDPDRFFPWEYTGCFPSLYPQPYPVPIGVPVPTNPLPSPDPATTPAPTADTTPAPSPTGSGMVDGILGSPSTMVMIMVGVGILFMVMMMSKK